MNLYERKYKEALERARDYKNGIIHKELPVGTHIMDYIFPELKEDEDEKTRKEIISALQYANHKGVYNKHLAWLEKQGDINETINRDEFAQGVLREAAINLITWIDYNAAEGNMCLSNMECKDIEDALVNGDWNKIYTCIKKKLEKQTANSVTVTKGINSIINVEVFPHPTVIDFDGGKCTAASTTIEPKFKVGDYIVNDYCRGKVIALTDDAYLLDTEQGIPFSYEHNVHLWTIQDAKDGDVLQLGEVTAIFKECIGNEHCICYCSFCKPGGFEIPSQDGCDNSYGCYNTTPATKEQRDLLFSKMKEAGYTFDFKKKELKKIKQKPVWSEEDERMLVDCFNILHRSNYSIDKVTKTIDWFKSLKDRMKEE